jgi:penicillin-binding protein 2
MQTGADNISSMAFRFGFGRRTGLPLRAEAAGLEPMNDSMMSRYGYALSHGYLANACIGQGHVLSTPLQVAQMMAGVGNRRALPQVRLVQQIQDNDGKIVKHFPAQDRHPINVSNEYLDLVTQGMFEVVHGSRGTAPAAANSYHMVAGETDTGQWGAATKKQYVAWFAGFVPANAPKYAFAVLYEGSPGELLSGGRKAGR